MDFPRYVVCYSLLLILLIINVVAISGSNKNSIEAHVDFNVEGNGFHRKIHYNVDIKYLELNDCYLSIHSSLPSALYVNVDELADLQRLGENTICSEGEIDVELFAEDAGNQNVTVCSQLNPGKNTLSLPIHQRYQKPRYGIDYVNVTLPRPKLLLGCKQRFSKYPVSKIDLCSPCVDLAIKWREIPYDTATKDFVWQIPVGNSLNKTWVSYATLLATLIGTVIVLRALWQSNIVEREKTK